MSLCTANVNRGDSRWPRYFPCGREAVADGLCKLHLRVRDKRRAKDAEWNSNHDRGTQLQAEAARLSDVLGITVRPHYDWPNSKYTENMVVPLQWITRIAEEKP